MEMMKKNTSSSSLFCFCRLLVFLLLLDGTTSMNYTQEFYLFGTNPDTTFQTERKEGAHQGLFRGRGMTLNVRIRPSGSFAYTAAESGLGMFYRQYIDGNLGHWTETTHLKPNDLPADVFGYEEGSSTFYAGIYESKQEATADRKAIIGGRDGMRSLADKFAIGGNPSTEAFILVSAFGFTYTGEYANSQLETGQAYIFTGEYYHWTQSTTLRHPSYVDDGEYHFGRCVSIDKQSMDTAAISCSGCDPGSFKTNTIVSGLTGSQGRGAVYIYAGSESSGYKKWSATQLLWPRHNKWYYFGGGFLAVDGNTLVTDACKGTHCTDNTFVQREYDSPATDLFVYVKQAATGLWSEQQVLTDPVMETNAYSKTFCALALHDDTIVMGYALSVQSFQSKGSQGARQQQGVVMVWYPNKPSYELQGTYRRKRDVGHVKPSPATLNQHQWSMQQVIRDEVNAGAYPYFGQMVSISGDRMSLGSRGGFGGTKGTVMLLTRERQGGFWSTQQVLMSPDDQVFSVFGASVYNTHFTSHGVHSGSSPFVKYFSEMAHGKWKCLLVSMFDEFGDGWDIAKLRVDAPDGTYDYYYPDCNAQNPLEFEYCPSMAEQGGTYKFSIENGKESSFNWEIEWKVQMNLVGWRDIWGNSSDVFIGSIHSKMAFNWNPVTLSFEKVGTEHLLSATVSCTDCASRDDSHRMLIQGGDYLDTPKTAPQRSLHLTDDDRTASPTVSPAPTMRQSVEHLAEWEKLVMTTTDPLKPWFQSDRTGTYFYLSDLQGKRLLRKEAQCGGGLTPLTHSCWLNYPDPIPDGEYIARIGGARADGAVGFHTWSFCGVDGGQSEHLQFRVHHGSCYPVTRFTKARYCSFREGTGVLADMSLTLEMFDGLQLSTLQEKGVLQALVNIFPRTKASDFSISQQRRDDDGHLHITFQLSLKLEEHGYDSSDFTAVSDLESKYSMYFYEASTSGALSEAVSSALKAAGLYLEQGNVKGDVMAFETAFIPSGTVDVDDDAPVSYTESVNEEWLADYTPATHGQVRMYSLFSYVSDAVAMCGYIAALLCLAYGMKTLRLKYRRHSPAVERDIESATAVLQDATVSFASKSKTRLSTLQNKLLNALDDFSDYVVDGEVTHDSSGALLIAPVVIPVDELLVPPQRSNVNGSPPRNLAAVEHRAESSGEEDEDDEDTVIEGESVFVDDSHSSSGDDSELLSVSQQFSSSSSESLSESSSGSSSDDDKCYVMSSFK